MPKLALIREQFRPDGGAERFINRLAEGLQRQGHFEPHLITRSWVGQPSAFPKVPLAPQRSASRKKRQLDFATAVQQHLSQTPYDLVQSHEKIPGVMIYRAGDGLHAAWLEARAPILSPLRRWWQQRDRFHRQRLDLERATLEHPALKAIVCPSRGVQRQVETYYPAQAEKTVLIYNGIDTQTFHPVSHNEKMCLRQQADLNPDAFILLFSGSGWERKGLGTALEALKYSGLAAKVQLVILGNDKQCARYARQVNDSGLVQSVHFAGVIADPLRWNQLADAFILPSVYEPFSNAALEALASGLPVILSDACGAAELIDDGVQGFRCPAGNSASFAECLQSITSDTARLAEMQKAARVRACTQDISRMIQDYEALYSRLLIDTGRSR